MTMYFSSRQLLIAFALSVVPMLGCNDKKPATTKQNTTVATQKESEIVAALELHQDLENIRKVLQQLDNLDGNIDARAKFTADEQAILSKFVSLNETEWAEIRQQPYSQIDAAYLEECLLVRAAIRGLEVDQKPALERASHAFAWASRMVYLDQRIPWPAPPWATLQGGAGVSLSRAYVVLAAWQQARIDGFFIGPPKLQSSQSFSTPNPQEPDKIVYAPVRACGAFVDGEMYLFNHTTGLPIAGPNGKGIATLSQVCAEPKLAESIAPLEEVKTWQPFLGTPMSALAKRLQTLEELNPGNGGVKLYVDVVAQRNKLRATLPNALCEVWNPANDPHTLTRVTALYTAAGDAGTGSPALRDRHRVLLVPLELMPKLDLAGGPQASVRLDFGSRFEGLRWSPGSPRDYLLRGMFKDATAGLMHLKTEIEKDRNRIEQNADLLKEFQEYSNKLSSYWANVERARRSNDPIAVAEATKSLESFAAVPRNRTIQRTFVMTFAAKPLLSDINYALAVCVHERAERATIANPSSAQAEWQNARDWWKRYLDSSAESGTPFPARDQHARTLFARCDANVK